jgi:hypothetical protein
VSVGSRWILGQEGCAGGNRSRAGSDAGYCVARARKRTARTRVGPAWARNDLKELAFRRWLPADMARIYSPDRRSRPPDPLRRSTRPARISPSGRVSFWGHPIREARCWPPFQRSNESGRGYNSCSILKRSMMCSDSGVSPEHNSRLCKRLSLRTVREGDHTSRRATATAFSCRQRYPSMHSRRSLTGGAFLPSAVARTSSSCTTADGGGTITASSNSSTEWTKPSG